MVEEKKFYLTKEGLARIKKEQEALKDLMLAKTRGESPKVMHSEDLNPEYLAFQEDMNFLQKRVSELANILKNIELIKLPKKGKKQIVDLGATIMAEIDGELDEFKIVGTLEADPASHRISNESPIGQAILGKKVGETVVIKTPLVNHSCKIIKIKYSEA